MRKILIKLFTFGYKRSDLTILVYSVHVLEYKMWATGQWGHLLVPCFVSKIVYRVCQPTVT